MRKDTLMMIPEIQGEQKETFQTLIDLGQTKKQIEVINEQKDRAHNMMGNFTDEFQVLIDSLIAKGITAGTLKQMKDEEIDALYVKEDGTVITLNVPMESEKQAMDFKRDFLGMLINNKIQFDKIDETMGELNKMTEDYNEEVRNIFAEINGDVSSYVYNTLEGQKATATPDQIKAIEQVQGAIDSGITLQPLYDTYKKLDPHNTINDFLRRGPEYAEKYQRNCKNNGIAADYSRFDFLEAMFLDDERYHQYRNFLIFLVVKMFAHKKNFSRLDGIFLTQLVVNIQTLLYDHHRGNNLSPEQLVKRETLIKSIKRVLDLFYPVATNDGDKIIIGVDVSNTPETTATVEAPVTEEVVTEAPVETTVEASVVDVSDTTVEATPETTATVEGNGNLTNTLIFDEHQFVTEAE